jgi:hypothetical protein
LNPERKPWWELFSPAMLFGAAAAKSVLQIVLVFVLVGAFSSVPGK